jgi:hypothetical protein
MTTRARLGAFLTVMAFAVAVAPANAYIDPVSGSIVFQALIAGIAAAGTGVAMFWTRIVLFFRRSSGTASDASPDTAPGAASDPTPEHAGSDQP